LRALDFRDEDLRPPLLRPAEDLRPPRRRDDFLPLDDLRALPARLLVERLRAPLRPEDPDRDRFLPPLRLDFLAAAIGNSV
jgi:hypothetical protein